VEPVCSLPCSQEPLPVCIVSQINSIHTFPIYFLKIHITAFSFEDGGCMFLRNVGIYLQVHTALQPRRPTSTYLPTDWLTDWPVESTLQEPPSETGNYLYRKYTVMKSRGSHYRKTKNTSLGLLIQRHQFSYHPQTYLLTIQFNIILLYTFRPLVIVELGLQI
jgi:hypothetical protein